MMVGDAFLRASLPAVAQNAPVTYQDVPPSTRRALAKCFAECGVQGKVYATFNNWRIWSTASYTKKGKPCKRRKRYYAVRATWESGSIHGTLSEICAKIKDYYNLKPIK